MDAAQEWRKGAHPAWVAAPLLAKNPPPEVGCTGRSGVDWADEWEEELASWPGALVTE